MAARDLPLVVAPSCGGLWTSPFSRAPRSWRTFGAGPAGGAPDHGSAPGGIPAREVLLGDLGAFVPDGAGQLSGAGAHLLELLQLQVSTRGGSLPPQPGRRWVRRGQPRSLTRPGPLGRPQRCHPSELRGVQRVADLASPPSERPGKRDCRLEQNGEGAAVESS